MNKIYIYIIYVLEYNTIEVTNKRVSEDTETLNNSNMGFQVVNEDKITEVPDIMIMKFVFPMNR